MYIYIYIFIYIFLRSLAVFLVSERVTHVYFACSRASRGACHAINRYFFLFPDAFLLYFVGFVLSNIPQGNWFTSTFALFYPFPILTLWSVLSLALSLEQSNRRKGRGRSETKSVPDWWPHPHDDGGRKKYI